MNLTLVRHGEILSNVKKIYAGRSPEGLTDEGRKQALEVATQLEDQNIEALYSSPIRRAVETAETIGNAIGKEIILEPAFREMEMGPWEGLSEVDIAQNYSREWNIWNSRPAELKIPGRETLEELLKRVLKGIYGLKDAKKRTNIVIVTHVAVIRVLLLWHAGEMLNLYKTIHVPNAQLFQITVDIDN